MYRLATMHSVTDGGTGYIIMNKEQILGQLLTLICTS